jgi:ABC-2 type transport system ATP-binding protein
MAGPLLQAIGLSKRYGDNEALRSLDLAVHAGEIYCLLGANGAGKTTTINLFLNFIDPSAGEARVCGLDVTREARASKRHLAYIPEQVMLYGDLTALENVDYFSRLAGLNYGNEPLRGYLARCGLQQQAADRPVRTFSKGMRQKVGVAIALAKNAQVLLLDEPTSGLDPKASNEFSRLIEELRQGGAAVLMATHDLFRAKESGSRIGIMREGRLLHEIAAAEIAHVELERLYLELMG